MDEGDMAPALLPEAEHREVLEGLILPAWTAHAVPQDQPVVVVVGGPPGSGKTEIADLVHASLAGRGGAVRIGSDLYKHVHRYYTGLLADDVRTAGVKVRPDVRRWQSGVEAHVRDRRLDAVVESALADPQQARADARAYRDSGHRVEVVVLATALAWSQLGVLDRYLGASDGAGRYVSWGDHDTCARQLSRSLDLLEAEHLVDRITVVRRGMRFVYGNELVAGTWIRSPGAARAVEAERARWWSAVETASFRRSLARAERALVRAETRLPADHVLAVARDAERARALAEPVRRAAQPAAAPPGVDYHRLSADEHEWTFQNLILPDLGEIVAQERPVVVYVMGAPGAGKTRATAMVRRAMRARRPVWIAGELFKAAHPDYLRLLREHPRTASARIRADYKAWQARAEAYVRERRADAVIEIAPGSANRFLGDTAAWDHVGYRVELLVLDVRAPDSRQSTALRYAEVSRSGTRPGRFTTASGHDRCLAAVLECVQAVEEQRLVDHISVVRRDGSAMFRNALGADGRWTGPVGAALAARAGQVRPYTDQEARQFLARQRELRTALPQYRREVDAITRLAWPLLPAALQPGRLTVAPPAPTSVPGQATTIGHGDGVALDTPADALVETLSALAARQREHRTRTADRLTRVIDSHLLTEDLNDMAPSTTGPKPTATSAAPARPAKACSRSPPAPPASPPRPRTPRPPRRRLPHRPHRHRTARRRRREGHRPSPARPRPLLPPRRPRRRRLDGPEAVRSRWRALVTARQDRLRTAR
ncbi:zeta toxin family protein [Kitasatospora sp. NPDC004669]|uniref:zeta toxin family protein n=1 Tax=Kitasatospora sp. NPDC004669 TaxID=3154555 RepID=UPI0033BAC025